MTTESMGRCNLVPSRALGTFTGTCGEGWKPNVGNPKDVNELIAWQGGPWHPPVFTHSHLSSLNILADKDEAVGIGRPLVGIQPTGSTLQQCRPIRTTCFGKMKLTTSWIRRLHSKLWRRFVKNTLGISEPKNVSIHINARRDCLPVRLAGASNKHHT